MVDDPPTEFVNLKSKIVNQDGGTKNSSQKNDR